MSYFPYWVVSTGSWHKDDEESMQSLLFITYCLVNINKRITSGHFASTICMYKLDYNIGNVSVLKKYTIFCLLLNVAPHCRLPVLVPVYCPTRDVARIKVRRYLETSRYELPTL